MWRFGLAVTMLGCSGPDPEPVDTGTVDTGTAPAGALHWSPLDVDGVVPRWGALGAGALQVGGLDADQRILTDALSVQADEALHASAVGALQTGRYCGCALHDPTREQLVLVGGRNGGFRDEPTAERIDLATGESTPLDAGGAAAHPVGCWAFFSVAQDRGYVFGGASNAVSGETWRYDPATGAFTALDLAGPSARYDAGMVALDDGTALLVGGMGGAGFDSEVWRFDPAAEAWTALPPSTDPPDGRRFPFTATDGQRLYYGYGTDSPMGTTVRRDLWRFDPADGAWEALAPEGERPAARSFAVAVPGPAGSLGALAFGVDGDLAVFEDAWVLWPQ
ncbi:MAG: kelch repeat-containing protein [Myxococcota bacterium]